MLTDRGSSASTSPKDDLYTQQDARPLLFGDYQYKSSMHLNRPVVDSVLQSPSAIAGSRLPTKAVPANLTSFGDIDNLSAESLRSRLKKLIEVTRELAHHVSTVNYDLEKQRRLNANLQSMLSMKEADLKEQNQELAIANQRCDAQATELKNLRRALANYQSALINPTHVPDTIHGKDNTNRSKFGFTKESVLSQGTSNYYLNDMLQQQTKKDRKIPTTSATSTAYLLENFAQTAPRDTSHWETETSFPVNGKKHDMASLDYRRMLEKQNNVDWDALVSQIIEHTDQQASIFMQQKLKCATDEQKENIIKAALKRAAELMTNRFGNFLVQRLFELGTSDHVRALVDSMQGHVVELTCDPFACHVVQKALDVIDEKLKSHLVFELTNAIPKTITHKYACHVWQKICTIQWIDESPSIMAHMHAELQGQWAQVALDENGSLVVQNVFENLTDAEKTKKCPLPNQRPILEEVLANVVMIAKGQWGNWVIQHILEQAEDNTDRRRAFQTVLDECVQLSTDQFASKVVEKALRVGGPVFLTQFVDHITSPNRVCRSRIALVDIASDQYGNYVIQWLLNNANSEQRICMSRLIKRHMVSLRGSKYGQRVAFLVEKVLQNCEITTYPATANTVM
ncbi:hypothetical protein EC973_000309 [Apophysomyces ossiformis]|uniref:PUM-HD domain-containing protein n=1 Tax=Apophysomyces ossiformis TaxID=679940 RepID=A0A8H7BRX9_9FUNG|nr:hypothetical protein EC973_000309 [Apophysomyces ossiformis]